MARILIVDDSIIMRRMLQHIVEKACHEVVGLTGNGDEAVKLCKELRPDLVTMDVMLGESDGIQVLSDIMKEFPEAKVIMITALGWENKRAEALNLGAAGYIRKPFDALEIRKEIERVMGKSQIEMLQSMFMTQSDDEQ